MGTMENLAAAFAGESQANRKYLAFAAKAEKEGFAQVGKLFRAAAEAETIHAHAHLWAMGGINSTLENLEAAVEGEAHEFKEMYPKFLATAQEEGNKKAVVSFKNAMPVEETHHGLYLKALDAVKAGKDLDESGIHICPVCGHTVDAGVPDTCPVCNVPGKKFIEIS
ncbi:MAG: rubrerythrin family protein [Desulfobacter sp.]|nr:rubrerythrin family protein [Desulfobacter sp.]WDP83988.1 MAG: rubrerythrin family protein [Desulfobacter sp.]